MKELNPHILKVMQWLQNPESISREELRNNLIDADVAYYAAYDAYEVAEAACSSADHATSPTRSDDAAHWRNKTKERLSEYFKLAAVIREEYEKEVKRLNESGVKNEN